MVQYAIFQNLSTSRNFTSQLENVYAAEMILNFFIPAFIFAWPSFVFYSVAYILPDDYIFLRCILLAILDLWIALLSILFLLFSSSLNC
ncbi:hypothetical protein PFISCL1PPCAC_2581, partial [Pristionchus fissidentatus]